MDVYIDDTVGYPFQMRSAVVYVDRYFAIINLSTKQERKLQ